MENICLTCKQPPTGKVSLARFKCPKCLKYDIVRCSHCRTIAAKYTCPACSFEGPN